MIEDGREEELLIKDIKYNKHYKASFDVYAGDELLTTQQIRPIHAEFLGKFHSVPHGGGHMKDHYVTTDMQLGLPDLPVDDDTVTVTLMPKVGTPSIGGIDIGFC